MYDIYSIYIYDICVDFYIFSLKNTDNNAAMIFCSQLLR